MSDDRKVEIINDVQGVAKFFELNITLKIFGHVVWSWIFPPKN